MKTSRLKLKRRKRSYSPGGGAWTKLYQYQNRQGIYTWNLRYSYNGMTGQQQRDEIFLALTTWERAANICFKYLPNSHRTNFYVGFTPDYHHGSVHAFHGNVAVTRPGSYVQLNRDVEWQQSTHIVVPHTHSKRLRTSAVLSTVLQHEFGHLLGLSHSGISRIMNANYNKNGVPSGLSPSDRERMLTMYGRCSVRFDVVFDAQYLVPRHGGNGRVYNTYITSEDVIWQYINEDRCPDNGYPQKVAMDLPGFQGRPTAMFQVYSHTNDIQLDYVYAIRGWWYYKYRSLSTGLHNTGQVGYVDIFGIPRTTVDAVVYDYRVKQLLFFINDKVFVSQPVIRRNGSVNEFLPRGNTSIASLFPMASYQPKGYNDAYCTGVDVAYIHLPSYGRMYFIKGEHLWENIQYRNSDTTVENSMQYRGRLSDVDNRHLWNQVCNNLACK